VDKLVDSSQPIEAVHDSGAIGTVSPCALPSLPNMAFAGRVNNGERLGWDKYGRPLAFYCPWRIRNTAKPSTPSNEELTQRMELSLEMQARLVAFARQVASKPDWMLNHATVLEERDLREAKAIVSDLPKPVDAIDMADASVAWQELEALASLIERPPHDDVNLVQSVALRAAQAIRRVRAEREALHSALVDLVSWFPERQPEPEWRIKAGEWGADDAIAHARTLAAGGAAHE